MALSHGPNIPNGVTKRWPEAPRTLDVIFAEMNLVTVRVRQFEHAGVLARLRKTFGVERLAFARLVAESYRNESVIGRHLDGSAYYNPLLR